MKRIILFRFHKRPLVCKNRLTMLRHFNPGIEIYGLYGGKPENLKVMRKYLKQDLLHVYSIANKSDKWKWENSDLAVREWFKNYGHKVIFDILHLIEWDLLLFKSLEKLYPFNDKKSVYLTGIQKLSDVEDEWDWTAEQPTKSRWHKFRQIIDDKYGLPKPIRVCLGPGPAFPRLFLEKFIQENVSSLVHDEIRLPIMAEVLGFTLVDNGFYKKWYDPSEAKIFNCYPIEIETTKIPSELNKPKGRRAFHPYRKIWKPNP